MNTRLKKPPRRDHFEDRGADEGTITDYYKRNYMWRALSNSYEAYNSIKGTGLV
jgi:hypothetical protein